MNYNNLLDAIVQFYLDNPQKCLKILQNLQTKDTNVLKQKDVLMYRCYIALRNYRVPLDEINQGTASTELKSVRLLAKYFSDTRSQKEVLLEMEDILNGNLDVENDVTLLMAGTIYLHEMRPEQALKVLHNGDSLECQSMAIQALVQMHRVDLAHKELKKMLETNEDDVLTQIALATVNLSVGGDKLREAFNIYQELLEKYQAHTNLIRNGQAVALLGLGKPEEAEPILQDAMDKNPNDPETLINMIVLSQMLGKPFEITNRFISQLKDSHPNHPFVKDFNAKEAEFDHLMENYEVSVAIQSMAIQALVQMHRVDLAHKELKKMLETNEDDVLTQIALATVNLSVGGDKLREAFNIYQELLEKYQAHTNLIRNGQAVALLGLGKPEEAEPILQDAMDKNPNDPETLINMIVLSQMLGKPFEITNRFISQLKDSHPNHPFVKDFNAKEAEFDHLMENYEVSVAM